MLHTAAACNIEKLGIGTVYNFAESGDEALQGDSEDYQPQPSQSVFNLPQSIGMLLAIIQIHLEDVHLSRTRQSRNHMYVLAVHW